MQLFSANDNQRSKRSFSTEELRNDFPQAGRAKVGHEIEGTLARRPLIFQKPVCPRTGASDRCTVTMIDR